MSKTKGLVQGIVSAAGSIVANEKVQKALFGTYSDGTPRSLPDCIEGEILSPTDRERMLYRKKLKKNRKKKHPASSSNKKPKRKSGKINLA